MDRPENPKPEAQDEGSGFQDLAIMDEQTQQIFNSDNNLGGRGSDVMSQFKSPNGADCKI